MAADVRIRKVLAYDPQNEYFLDMKNQLKVLTAGDPEKAEGGRMLMQKAREHYERGEYNEVLRLREKHPEIMAAAPEVRAIAERAESLKGSGEKKREYLPLLERYEKMLDDGRIEEALEGLKSINREVEGFSEAQTLLAKAQGKTFAMRDALDRAKELLGRGDSASCREKLRIFLDCPVTVGRVDGNDVVIESMCVSKAHVEIRA